MKFEKNRNFDLKENLEKKRLLIDSLKNLICLDNKMTDKYLKFKRIQEKWNKTGPVPRTEDGVIWNNYQHHIKNFYDYLHLNRKFKEIDIKHNKKQKENLIKKAKELIKDEDKNRSYKYFERLKKKWKYEIGPTTEKVEVKLNEKFIELGIKIFKNKEDFNKNKDSILSKNFLIKKAHLNELNDLINQKSNTSKDWQKKIRKFDKIKIKLETIGPIPHKEKNKYWKNYKDTLKKYYLSKNIFFKNLKKIYRENILKQDLLLKKTEDLKNKENIKKEIILIQKEWNKINPVPYKINERNWKKFKFLCNNLFNKINEEKVNKITEIKNNEKKQRDFLNKIENDSSEINVDKILIKWKELSTKNKDIDDRFEKVILEIFKSSGLSQEEAKTKLFEFQIQTMEKSEKNQKIIVLNKELDVLNKEVSALENNLSFFNEKSKESDLLKNVYNNIEKNKKNIENILYQIKILRN